MTESFVVDCKQKAEGFAKFSLELQERRGYVKWTWTHSKDNSWPMKKTWRMWMAETAKWMAANGVTMPLLIKPDGTIKGTRPFDANDAHELWVKTWLGVDGSGERYKTASGDKGQMLQMMDKHLIWAAERGLSLTIPRDGEYQKLKQQTES